jgi:hypothetical protein
MICRRLLPPLLDSQPPLTFNRPLDSVICVSVFSKPSPVLLCATMLAIVTDKAPPLMRMPSLPLSRTLTDERVNSPFICLVPAKAV